MTRVSRTAPLLAAIVALALAGCAAPATAPGSTPEPQSTAAGDCSQVAVVVDFGPLDEPAIADCVAAGPAADILGFKDASVVRANQACLSCHRQDHAMEWAGSAHAQSGVG